MSDDRSTPAKQAPPPAQGRRLHPAMWTIIISVGAVLVVALALVATRYGLVTSPGRLFIEARLDGLKLGRFGRLQVTGLDGDVFTDFTIDRLTVRDEQGVWLEAREVHVDWHYAQLFLRRFEAEEVTARQVRLLRRPTLTPKGESRDLPVSFEIERMAARVEMLPEFSYRRGLFDFSGSLLVERKGPKMGHIEAQSLLHQGDYLKADFEVGREGSLNIAAKAFEARGGALAGALGLPTDRPFRLAGRASGTTAVGQFNLDARSGNETPLRGLGAWNDDGGAAAGWIDLTASTLTRRYVDRFGPRAQFSIGGSRFRTGDYMIDGEVEAENLRVVLKGPADLIERELTQAGMAVTVQTGSVQRIFGGVVDAAVTTQGRLRGKWSDWAYEADVTARDVTGGGYRLARASGEAQLVRRRGEFTLTGELAGAGGQGPGYLAAALGAQPRLVFVGSRLKSGDMLIRRLVATGPGLALEATGRRTLLGNFSFEGEATLSNLSAVNEGAGGVVRMDWKASRRGARGSPWNYDFDARGRDFSSGWSEADRLLGETPRLRADGDYHQGVITVDSSILDGAAGTLRAQGRKGREGALDFDLAWNAEGPFQIGPMEVSGDASGTGELEGTLTNPRAQLVAEFDEIDVPRLTLTDAEVTLSFRRSADATDGTFALNAGSGYGPARLNTDFRFVEGGVNLTGLDADIGGIDAEGAVALRKFRPSSADLQVSIGPGVLLDRGRVSGTVEIVDRAGGAYADIQLTARDAVPAGAEGVVITSGTLSGQGPMSRLPISIQAEGLADPGPWEIDGAGVLASSDAGYTLTLNAAGELGRAGIRTVEAAVLRFGGEEQSARLRLAVGEGRADIDARLGPEAADVTAVVDNVALGALNEDLAGRFDARATLRGRGETLTGSLDATLRGARGRGLPRDLAVDGSVQARLSDDNLAIQAAATNAQGLRANADVVLPVEASAAPFRLAVAMRRPMRGTFFADGEIKPLWDLFMGGERSLAGRVIADGRLAGTLADPRVTGEASVRNGSFEDGATGLLLRDLQLTANFQGEAIDVATLTATDGEGGRLGGSGRISLERDGASSFRVDLSEFQVIDNDMATATATGAATLNRDAQGRMKLTGDLTIDRAEIAAEPLGPAGVVEMDVIEINRPPRLERGLRREPSRGAPVALDVDLTAPRRVFVEGRGLNVELSLDAHVGGTTQNPQLSGVARVVRGDYNIAGKRFEFDEGGAIYLGSSLDDIRLDLTATRSDPSLTAIIRIHGTAADPEITLSSTPQLPADEVLSQVLFGASASQLSAIEAAQLASAISALAGGGGFDVIGGLRGLTGLDRLTFGGGEAGGLTVAGGKYLTDDVYLEIIGGGREGPAVQVEWLVRRNLAIVSRISGDDDTRLSVRWRRDY